jgi:hypothetical protein
MDITPVERRRFLAGTLFQELFDGGSPSRTGFSGKEEIESVIFHPQGKVDGAEGPLLTNGHIQFGELISGHEIELGQVALPPELVNGYFQVVGHVNLLLI